MRRTVLHRPGGYDPVLGREHPSNRDETLEGDMGITDERLASLSGPNYGAEARAMADELRELRSAIDAARALRDEAVQNLSTEFSRRVEAERNLAEVRRIVQDVSPLMLAVNAFGADEADEKQLADMARWYTQEQQRDYSAFDVWFDAYKSRTPTPRAAGGRE